MKLIALPLAVLIAFTAYTVFSMSQAEQSLIQFGIRLMSNLDTAQVVIDLYILAALACIWMYHDNKSRGKSFASVMPYLLVTVVFVSICPLLYLVVKGFSKHCCRASKAWRTARIVAVNDGINRRKRLFRTLLYDASVAVVWLLIWAR